MNALVPYTSGIMHYLEKMVSDSYAGEIAKEVVLQAHENQVRRIMFTSKYDFKNHKKLSFNKRRKNKIPRDIGFPANNTRSYHTTHTQIKP